MRSALAVLPCPVLRYCAVLALSLIGFAPPSNAGEIVQTYEFSDPIWRPSPDGRDFEIPTVPGLRTLGHPGEPQLPVGVARVLLPPGEDVSVLRIEAIGPVISSTHLPAPGETPYPFSMDGPIPLAEPKVEIYSSENVYPDELGVLVTVQIYRGYRIAYVNLFPLRARPGANRVEFVRALRLTVETAPSSEALMAGGRTYRPATGSTLTWLDHNVDNPRMADRYEAAALAGDFGAPPRPERSIVDPTDTYLYLIITSVALEPAYAALATDRTAKGLPARIVTVDEIYANYSGVDAQQQVRNFILDAYQGWDTEYILFAGDINVIPDRDCYVYVIDEGNPMETNDLCCELYYEGLDGTWNDDFDDRWGEVGEEDLIPEVHTARLCADNAAEAQNFITKLLRYEREPVVGETVSASFFGEYLWTDTWGEMYMEEIRLGADSWGYTTAGVPLTWETSTYYEMSGSWSGSDYINDMNSGTHQMHHLGHSSTSYNAKVYTSDIPSFTADGLSHTYNVGYSQGCDAGGFDGTDAILEEFVLSPTGFVGWIGNTRSGFGVHYTTNGSSQYYHRQYVDALFAEGLNELAAANDDSRTDNVAYIDYESNRWVHYELVAFGDPAMPVWTAAPQTPLLNHAGVLVLGTTEYAVTIEAGGQPIEGARVCVWDEVSSTYDFGVTDAFGQVLLHPDPSQPGTLHLVISDANLLVTEVEIPIVPDGPFVILYGHEIHDDVGGNGDGDADIGEEIELIAALQNVWTGTVSGVTATLDSDNEYVSCSETAVFYGDLEPGAIEYPIGDGFHFTVGGDCPDQEVVAFTITIEDDADGLWTGTATYVMDAPALTVVTLVLDDSAFGDGDGLLDPGESALLSLHVGNDGHCPATTVAATFQSTDGWLTITQPNAGAPEIPTGGEAMLAPPFEIALDENAPSPGIIPCRLLLEGDWSLAAVLPVELGVGGFRDDMEAGEGSWTHEVVSSGFVDDWHVSTQRNHTSAGSYSWKFGDIGAGDYSDLADGALITPVIEVADITVLTFWHWMDAETSGAYPDRAYDGGIIEMSVDGGAWGQITPDGGYSHLVREGSTPGPFPEDTPIFSGSHDWEQVTCTLDTTPGTAQFRFRFGSDGAVGAQGWYVDDVELTSWNEASGVDETFEFALRPRLSPNRPNPFPAETRIQLQLPREAAARVAVLDAQGRLVRTLVDGALAAGVHILQWDGRHENGRPAGSGVYFYKLDVNGFTQVRKMTLLR